VMTDLLFNQPHLPGFMGWILRWVTRSTGRFGMTPPARLMMLTDRSALASWLRQQADAQGLAAICVGHGDPITNQCADRLHEAADAL